jgi:two-component system, NarL family, sensor kinase
MIKKISFLVFVYFYLFFNNAPLLHAQTVALDSLQVLLSKTNQDTQRIQLLNQIGRIQLGQSKKYEALRCFEEAFAIMENKGLENKYAFLYNSLANIYNIIGENDKAMQLAIRGLAIADRNNDAAFETILCNNICKTLNDTKRYAEAIEYSKRAVNAAIRINDERSLGIAYVNLANQYEEGFKDHQKAIELYKKSLELFKKIKFQRGIQAATNNLASMLYRTDNVDEALVLFRENLSANENSENKIGLPMNYLNIARVLLKKQQYGESKSFFEKAEITGRKYAEAATFLEILTHRAELDSAMGDYKSAFFYRNLQMAMQDSTMGDKINRNLSDLRIKYDTEKKQQQITLLDTKNQVQELSLTRQNLILKTKELELTQKNQSLQLASLSLENKELELFKVGAVVRGQELESDKQQQQIKTLDAEKQVVETKQALTLLQIRRRNLWLAGLVVLFAISGLIAYNFYTRRKIEQESALKFALSQQQILAAKAVLETEERERRRIAGDLHDGVAQLIVASKMHLASMGSKLTFKSDEERKEFEKVMDLISESADEIRSVSHLMMPNVLLKVGLVSALQEFIQKVNTAHLNVYLDSQGLDVERLDSEIETTVFRVIQESINNTIKHANATRLDIQIVKEKKELSITIEDNGKGFVVKNGMHAQGIGLKNLRSRIQYLKGTVDIESAPGQGTLLAIYVPI